MRIVSDWLDLDWKYVTLGLHLEEVRKGGRFGHVDCVEIERGDVG